MITALRSLAYTMLFYSGSLLLVLTALLVAWPWPAGVQVVATAWGRFHRFCTRWLLGQKVRVDGGRLSPRGNFKQRAGVITYTVGEVIPTGLDRREAEARVHAAINALNPAHSFDKLSPNEGE